MAKRQVLYSLLKDGCLPALIDSSASFMSLESASPAFHVATYSRPSFTELSLQIPRSLLSAGEGDLVCIRSRHPKGLALSTGNPADGPQIHNDNVIEHELTKPNLAGRLQIHNSAGLAMNKLNEPNDPDLWLSAALSRQKIFLDRNLQSAALVYNYAVLPLRSHSCGNSNASLLHRAQALAKENPY